ncbi:MAG: helix-turn-helix domain-containing protein [Planctomycetota bacterium]
MPKCKREKLLPQARTLAAEGVPKPEIAAALDVAPSTIYRWAKRDAAAGRPWDEKDPPSPPAPAPPAPNSADRLYRRLQERLERLIDESDTDAKSANLENRMLKLCKVLDHLREQRDDLEGQLRAIKRFGSFCARRLPEDEMAPVRKAIRLFLDELKREHS